MALEFGAFRGKLITRAALVLNQLGQGQEVFASDDAAAAGATSSGLGPGYRALGLAWGEKLRKLLPGSDFDGGNEESWGSFLSGF